MLNLKNKRCNKKGFTLIEVLVATSIFVLTMVVLSQIFISVIRSEKLAYALLNTENTIRNNLELMARAIRMGTEFYQLNPTEEADICFKNSVGKDQCFYFDHQSLYQRIEGVPSALINSSSSDIKIKKGSFRYFNKIDEQPVIRVQIWAQTEVKGQLYDFKVETSITPRTIEIES